MVVHDDIEGIRSHKMRSQEEGGDGLSTTEWEEYKNKNWGDIRRRCRRIVPPPSILLRRMKLLEETYPEIVDAETGKPFFSKETWKRWKSLLDHAEKGCLSDPDPAVVALYYVVGMAKNGTDILRLLDLSKDQSQGGCQGKGDGGKGLF